MSETLEFGDDKPKKTRSAAENREADDKAAEDAKALDDQIGTPGEIAAIDAKNPDRRALSAVIMRRRGFSYDAIAEFHDYASPRDARQAVTNAIAKSGTDEDVKTLRAIESMRLDRLLASVWQRAIDETSPDQLAFNRRASDLIEQIAKLHGLNAPTVLAVVNPDSDRFNQIVSEIHKAQNGEVDGEGNVLEFMEATDGTYEPVEDEDEEEGYEGGA